MAIFQLEMSDMQLTTRMISSEALVDSHKLRMGTLDDDDWDKIAHASAILSKTNIYIEDSSAIHGLRDQGQMQAAGQPPRAGGHRLPPADAGVQV